MLTRTNRTSYLYSRKFGVEIEVENLNEENAYSIIHLLDLRGWEAVYDGSLNDGIEFVSPLLTLEDLPKLFNLLKELKNAGAKVGLTTGLHVHVKADDLDAESLTNLVRLTYARAELFFQAIEQKRGLRYCRKFEDIFIENITKQGVFNLQDLRVAWYKSAGTSGRCHYDQSRYYLVNLHSFFEGKGVEFRLFDGTLDYNKLESYITFCLALVEYTKEVRGCSIIRPQLDNPKYAMRTFLTRQGKNGLNLNGPEFKTLRKVLVEHLPGDASFRNPEDRGGRWIN